jgi:putative hydrolase of the HAD superfamily
MTACGVFFDLDDTLTDRQATIDRYVPYFIEDFGARLLDVDPIQISHTFWRSDQGGHNSSRERDVIEQLRWRVPLSEEDLFRHWSNRFPTLTVARDGARAVLRELRAAGMAVGVITNGPTARQRMKLELIGLWSEIGVCVISEAVGLVKPDRRIFDHACSQAGLSAPDCLFVGDHPFIDVIAAAQSGMNAAWFQAWGSWPSALGPAPVTVSTLAEVPSYAHSLFGPLLQ